MQLPDKRADKFEHRELLHNLVGGFIRAFRFDVQEQDKKVKQVTAPDRIHREGLIAAESVVKDIKVKRKAFRLNQLMNRVWIQIT